MVFGVPACQNRLLISPTERIVLSCLWGEAYRDKSNADSPMRCTVYDQPEISCAPKRPFSPHLSHVTINASPTPYISQWISNDDIVPICTMLLQNLVSKEGRQVVGHNVSQQFRKSEIASDLTRYSFGWGAEGSVGVAQSMASATMVRKKEHQLNWGRNWQGSMWKTSPTSKRRRRKLGL